MTDVFEVSSAMVMCVAFQDELVRLRAQNASVMAELDDAQLQLAAANGEVERLKEEAADRQRRDAKSPEAAAILSLRRELAQAKEAKVVLTQERDGYARKCQMLENVVEAVKQQPSKDVAAHQAEIERVTRAVQRPKELLRARVHNLQAQVRALQKHLEEADSRYMNANRMLGEQMYGVAYWKGLYDQAQRPIKQKWWRRLFE